MSPFVCRFLDAGMTTPSQALWRPASKKRQGTKSREVWHWRCSGRYGDLMAAPGWRVNVTPTGCGRRISLLARLEAYNWHLGKRLERITDREERRRERHGREEKLLGWREHNRNVEIQSPEER